MAGLERAASDSDDPVNWGPAHGRGRESREQIGPIERRPAIRRWAGRFVFADCKTPSRQQSPAASTVKPSAIPNTSLSPRYYCRSRGLLLSGRVKLLVSADVVDRRPHRRSDVTETCL